MKNKTTRVFLNEQEIDYTFKLVDKAMDNAKTKEEFELYRDIRVKLINGKESVKGVSNEK